ncbi:MAG: DUF1648 domain-containing protein [Crenarchaeota archaeon]|nr:DUF1648 domain-containing protein [Thermoproteota archaeon]
MIVFITIGIVMILRPRMKISSFLLERSTRARQEAEKVFERDVRLLGALLVVSALINPLLAPIVLMAGVAAVTVHALGKAEEGAERESIEKPEDVEGQEIRPDPFFKYATVASLLICALAMVPLLFLAGQLPEMVAVHYSYDFKPNGWMPKSSFIIFYSLFIMSLTFLAAVLSAVAYLKPETFFGKRDFVAILLFAEAVVSATFLYLLLANVGWIP